MKNSLMSVAQVTDLIQSGAVLLLAGSRAALSQLPKGQWIGGTTVYFVTQEGGCVDHDNIFVTQIEDATAARAVLYAGEDLRNLTMNRFDNGLSMILIPAFSQAHFDFALHASSYAGVFDQPLMGWITGKHIDGPETEKPLVYDGATGTAHSEGAVVLHVELGQDQYADLDILNLFEQDEDADVLVFHDDGFSATRALVNGRDVDFAAYVEEQGIDIQLPLVANYAGAMINVSFQSVDTSGVSFYAPVVAGVEYRLARSPGAYAEAFAKRASGDGANELSCNCILNFLYGELEGKKTGTFTGPATFGEIAYILLNQTMVRLSLQAQEQAAVA
ncbi:hypothetical protein AQS8620_01136 [Aquimixticola soesokkakensis]|uniref:Uncharacterized protein n=1 Tax=Aquimixticola soesokkakensis TaxID=1519096 RepID=A0A1Y5S6G0_9RHOB|nr:hypothetical protein [Aquimixticola soesokkakensis]SLN33347.1 hypothetical protein AQS8620_01136 [Aquimixticola soesokkakensis]